MLNKLLTLLLASVLALPLTAPVFAQEASAQAKPAKEARDSSTRWVSQEHGSKTVNDIDASQFKDGDRVICTGTWGKNGVLHATLISKRLTGL